MGLGIFEQFTETYQSLDDVCRRAHHFVNVLIAKNFKVVDERRSYMAGIAICPPFQLGDENIILPNRYGFSDAEITEVADLVRNLQSGQLAPYRVVNTHLWFIIDGFYVRSAEFSNPAIPLRAMVQIYKPSVHRTGLGELGLRLGLLRPKPDPIELNMVIGYAYNYTGRKTTAELMAAAADLKKELLT